MLIRPYSKYNIFDNAMVKSKSPSVCLFVGFFYFFPISQFSYFISNFSFCLSVCLPSHFDIFDGGSEDGSDERSFRVSRLPEEVGNAVTFLFRFVARMLRESGDGSANAACTESYRNERGFDTSQRLETESFSE